MDPTSDSAGHLKQKHPAADVPGEREFDRLLGGSTNSTKESAKSDYELDVETRNVPPSPPSPVKGPYKGLLTAENFFDWEKGVWRFWSLELSWRQLTVRERESGLFCFDTFRALAFLWVTNIHLQNGLQEYYSYEFVTWCRNATEVLSTSSQGVTVFFVISGFLNLMVAMNVSKRLNEQHFSIRAACTYMFRRWMHLCPNLYVAVILALLIGCTSGSSILYTQFCSNCKQTWWTDYILISNFSTVFNFDNCYDSLWSISAEMQMYFFALPIKAIYKVSPLWAFFVAFLLLVGVELLRTEIVLARPNNYIGYVYTPFYTRCDAYLMGMLLFMIYENLLLPIKKRTYAPEHLRGNRDSNGNLILPPQLELQQQEEKKGLSMWQVYFYGPLEAYVLNKHEQFWFFHTYAPSWMIVSIWFLWPLMGLFVFAGLQVCFYASNVTYWWQHWFFPDMSSSSSLVEAMIVSYELFATSLSTIGLLFFSLEGTIYPWAWLCRQYAFFTLGSLTYTGYLLSIPTVYVFFTILLKLNNHETVTWTEDMGLGTYVGWYLLVIVINLFFALIFSFLVERPLLNISKNVEIWPWAESSKHV